MKRRFAGDKKVGKSILMKVENRFKNWAVARIPDAIQTYHLTSMTVLWSLINIAVAFYAKENLNWLWIVNFSIVFQYLTDLLDGEVGRQRNTGLIKWGFYMDHILDYFFLSSLVFVGYMISPRGLEIWFFGLLVVLGSFMVNAFLSFAATNEFAIYHYGFGPTETRVVFILINLYIIYYGTSQFAILVPLVVVLCLFGLIINIFQIQKKLWQIDMDNKKGAA